MSRAHLTAEQQAEADALREHLMAAVATDLDGLPALLATKTDRDLFGATEFAVRDIVLRVGAKAVETALAERKKGGTTGAPESAPRAARRPGSSGGSASPS